MTMPTVEALPEKLLTLLSYDASSPLIFSSGLFLFLFAGFLLLYGMFRRAPMARIVYVILFSLYRSQSFSFSVWFCTFCPQHTLYISSPFCASPSRSPSSLRSRIIQPIKCCICSSTC